MCGSGLFPFLKTVFGTTYQQITLKTVSETVCAGIGNEKTVLQTVVVFDVKRNMLISTIPSDRLGHTPS